MTTPVAGAQNTDDATLLNMVRAGDPAAFGPLYQRHQQAARALARELVRTPAEVDEVVAEAFARVLDITRRGSGPTDAFRPYVLTVLRRVCSDRLRDQQSQLPGPAGALPGSDEPFTDPRVTELDNALIVAAYLSLPERWRAVLWHIEIEGSRPADVTALLGLSRNGVVALRDRALEGLRQGYLQMYMSQTKRHACVPAAERLGAFVRDSLSRRDVSMVTDHLSGCADCRAACADLTDVNAALRGIVAPIFLGDVAASYLSSSGHVSAGAAGAAAAGAGAAGAAAAGAADAGAGRHLGPSVGAHAGGANAAAGAHAGTADATLDHTSPLSLAGRIRLVPRRRRWLAVGAAAAVVAVAICAWAVTDAVTGTGSPGHHHALADGVNNAVLQPPPTSSAPLHSPAASPRAKRSASPRPAAAPQRAQAASSGPSPSAAPTPAAAAKLSVTVSVQNVWHGSGQVVFAVTDTGNAGTGTVTVSITLPSGADLLSGGPGEDGSGGWTCQPDSSGATCQHAAIPAGQQAQGSILVGVSQPACGQPVSIVAKSGSASASGKSPDIQCQWPGH
jgi:RNA polymerase sigma factor (sigma-70 family)